MSIEQDLKRLADGIERLVCIFEGQAGKIPAEDKPKGKVGKEKTTDAIPGLDGIEDITPAADAGMQNIEAATIKTQQELRDFAQKYLAASGDKSTQLLKYIKEEVCKLNKKEPKLITMPTENIVKAAQMIYNYCFKNDILVV